MLECRIFTAYPDLVSKRYEFKYRASGAEYLADTFSEFSLDGGERYEVINASPEKLCRILILSCVQPCFENAPPESARA